VNLERLKLAMRVLLGRNSAGRNVTIFHNDTVLCSYPKSGNTWTRFLVANMVARTQATFANIEQVVPDIYMWDDVSLKACGQSRILKSHEYFDPRYKRVVYIVRDPRDIAVSYYYHHRKFSLIADGMPLADFIAGFLKGKWDAFGSWGENVGSWLGARKDDSQFLMLRYEDLLSSPMPQMQLLACHLGLELSDQQLAQVIEHSSFENMRQMEKEQGSEWKALKASRKELPFVREGCSGGWQQVLSSSDAALIENTWHDLMRELGYLP